MDECLIADFQARRGPALAAIYRLHFHTLLAVALKVLHDRGDAEDCVHDVLLDIWTRRGSFRSDRGSLRAFLIVCVRNAALSRKRAASRHREIENALFEEQQKSEVVDFVEMLHLRSALATLPSEQLRALSLSFFAQRTHVEIARELNVPLGTVKSRLALALKKLSIRLRPE